MVVVFELAACHGFRVGVGAAEEVFSELGQLAGAEEALRIDHEGWQDLGVSVLLRMQVEHEADERTLEPRSGAHVDGKTRSAQFCGAFEVEDAERFAEFPVRLGFEFECGLVSPGFDGDVVGFRFAGGNFVAGQVGNARERQTHLLVECGGGLVELVEFLFQGTRFVHDGRCVLTGFLECSHLLAQVIAARLELLGRSDGFATALVQGSKIAQERSGIGTAGAQFCFHSFEVATDKSQIKHDSYQFTRR